jgi:hypothetical protein
MLVTIETIYWFLNQRTLENTCIFRGQPQPDFRDCLIAKCNRNLKMQENNQSKGNKCYNIEKTNLVSGGLPVHAAIGLSNKSVDIQSMRSYKSENNTLND